VPGPQTLDHRCVENAMDYGLGVAETRFGVTACAAFLAVSASVLMVPGCRKPRDLECQRTCSCEQLGRCSQEGNRCTVATDADCRRSRRCTILGACSAVEGKCRVTKDEDCAQSKTCKVGKNCTARDGSCKK